MKIGLQIPRFNWPGGTDNIGSKLAEIARVADRSGFHSIWVMDHFYQVGQGYGAPEEPMLEGYTALAYMAAITKNVKLGTMVTGSFYRHPGVLVKMVTTLDVMSEGRGILGIGAGWYELESRGMGVPFPYSLKERMGRFEETLKIAHHMWRDDRTSFEGKYYRLEEPICSPQPVSRPRPYIMIGGSGEKKTLRYVAKYGDACNLFTFVGPDVLKHKLDVLKRHCEDLGRPYDDIERTTLGTVNLAPDAMSPAQVMATCRELADLGIQHAIFNMPNVNAITPLEVFGREIIPEVSGF